MKNKIRIIGMAFISILCLGSCEKTYIEPFPAAHEEKVDNEDQVNEQDTLMIAPATWWISSFRVNNIDKTSIFKDWIFKFNTDNTVTAVFDYKDTVGTWNKRGEFIVHMAFSNIFPLTVLNDKNWQVRRHSPDRIILVSRKNNDIEVMRLQRGWTY